MYLLLCLNGLKLEKFTKNRPLIKNHFRNGISKSHCLRSCSWLESKNLPSRRTFVHFPEFINCLFNVKSERYLVGNPFFS